MYHYHSRCKNCGRPILCGSFCMTRACRNVLTRDYRARRRPIFERTCLCGKYFMTTFRLKIFCSKTCPASREVHQRSYVERNRLGVQKRISRWMKKNRDTLGSNYMKQRLSQQFGLRRAFITDELISLKRENLSMKRTVKQIKEMMQ